MHQVREPFRILVGRPIGQTVRRNRSTPRSLCLAVCRLSAPVCNVCNASTRKPGAVGQAPTHIACSECCVRPRSIECRCCMQSAPTHANSDCRSLNDTLRNALAAQHRLSLGKFYKIVCLIVLAAWSFNNVLAVLEAPSFECRTGAAVATQGARAVAFCSRRGQ